MSNVPEGMNPNYIREVVARARQVNAQIPLDAVPVQWSVNIDYLGDLEFDSGIMSSDEIEGALAAARDVIALPRGFQHVMFSAGEDVFHVVMDHTGLPKIYDQDFLSNIKGVLGA